MLYIYIDESGAFEPNESDRSKWIVQAGFGTSDADVETKLKQEFDHIAKKHNLTKDEFHASDLKHRNKISAYRDVLSAIARLKLDLFYWKASSAEIVRNFMGDQHGFRIYFLHSGLKELCMTEIPVKVFTDNVLDFSYLAWMKKKEMKISPRDTKWSQNIKKLQEKFTVTLNPEQETLQKNIKELKDFENKTMQQTELARRELVSLLNSSLSSQFYSLGRRDLADRMHVELVIVKKEEGNPGVVAADFISNSIFSKLENNNDIGWKIIAKNITWQKNWSWGELL